MPRAFAFNARIKHQRLHLEDEAHVLACEGEAGLHQAVFGSSGQTGFTSEENRQSPKGLVEDKSVFMSNAAQHAGFDDPRPPTDIPVNEVKALQRGRKPKQSRSQPCRVDAFPFGLDEFYSISTTNASSQCVASKVHALT